MKYSISLLLLLSSILFTGCFRPKNSTSEYHIPDMTTPAMESYIITTIKSLPGIETITANLNQRTITVSYQNKILRSMNIEELIATSGFSVNNRPAHPNKNRPTGEK